MIVASFDAFRSKPYPTLYGASQTAVTEDKLVVGLVVAIGVLGFTLLVVSPAIRGRKALVYFLKVGASLFVGCTIIVGNYGYGWQTGTIKTRTAYKAFTNHEVAAQVGLHVGLRGINITLKGEPEHQLKEQINYNERFSWGWQQFRIGFGPYANQLNREFRDAQWRGMPLPILWIAEYFTLDGENIRWNRGYREAGFYTHGLLWTAFGLWLIVNFLFLYSPRIGCYMWGLTGVILLTSVIMYTGIIHKWPELKIPFRDGDLELNYGWSFWLIVASGMFCIISFLALFVLDWRWSLLFMSLFDLTNEDCLLLEEDSQETKPLTLAPQRPRPVRKSRSRHSQIKPMYSVEKVTIENTSTCTLNGRTSRLTSSAVEMEVFVAKSSEDSI